MRPITLVIGIIVSLTSPGCGGPARNTEPSPLPSPAPPLQVGGAYLVTKSISENTCDGNLTPASGPLTVTHAPGGLAFTLNDTFSVFPGNLMSNGLFTIAPQATPPHQGAPVTTVFETGRFTLTGLEAVVRLDLDGPRGQPPFAACHVRQTWLGTKQGSPNVIP